MPIFGTQDRFAIEYELSESHFGEWMYGRFCYWVGCRRVGNFEIETSLRDVLFRVEELLRDKSLRNNPRFLRISATEAFKLLDSGMFGLSDEAAANVANDEQWARQLIYPPVDVFDGWKCFLLEDNEAARLIFSRHPYLEVNEVSLRSGEVDSVLEAACRSLDKIHEELIKRSIIGQSPLSG